MPVDIDGFTVRGVPYDNSGGTDDIHGLDLTLYERVEFRRTDGSGEVFTLKVGTYVVIEDRRYHLVRVFIQHGNPSTVELMLFNGSKRKILRVECTVDKLIYNVFQICAPPEQQNTKWQKCFEYYEEIL